MAHSIPIFPAQSLDATQEFYLALGFELAYRQDAPYWYLSMQHDDFILHFSKLSMWGTKHAVCLVFVAAIEQYHRQFSDALRKHFGKIPTAHEPRITRFRAGQTRFHIIDPSGNVLIYIDQNEAEIQYPTSQDHLSALEQALENAIFLRDTYVNDKAAARVLDLALQKHPHATPSDKARVIAARAELALAMGDELHSQTLRDELMQIPLTPEQKHALHDELHAADRLEEWITKASNNTPPL